MLIKYLGTLNNIVYSTIMTGSYIEKTKAFVVYLGTLINRPELTLKYIQKLEK